MITYYAVCNVNGPISVRLEADDEAGALEAFAALDARAAIDEPRMDAEDDLDIDGADMDEDTFDGALRAAGCVPVRDLAEVINGHSGAVYHLADGWYLWECPA